jgi:hypothetical protein
MCYETGRGLCGLVCPSRTSERGGKGDCVKERFSYSDTGPSILLISWAGGGGAK